jgi:hypothetical protein
VYDFERDHVSDLGGREEREKERKINKQTENC